MQLVCSATTFLEEGPDIHGPTELLAELNHQERVEIANRGGNLIIAGKPGLYELMLSTGRACQLRVFAIGRQLFADLVAS